MTHDPHDDDRGLTHDLTSMIEVGTRRRDLLKWGLGLSALPVLGCASSSPVRGVLEDMPGAGGSAPSGDCSTIPAETAGPFPGDGSNGANALLLSGIVRSDIRSSVAGAEGVAEGVLLTVTLTILDGQSSCAPLSGHAVYIWHCDRAGNYSMYSAAAVSENYLRGVQETDENGQVTFITIFPGCYPGRWPHIHFEIHPSLATATSGRSELVTSQLALPEPACSAAFATEGYEASVTNLARISLANDGVFADGAALQTAGMSGTATAGFAATLSVTI